MINPKSIKVIVMTGDATPNIKAAETWADGGDAIDLGDLKGTPFAKASFEPKSVVETQHGGKPFGQKCKIEISALIDIDDLRASELRAAEGKKVSVLVTPSGTPGTTNKYELYKNFILCRKGELNAGEPSFVTLYQDNVPCFDETEVFEKFAAFTV